MKAQNVLGVVRGIIAGYEDEPSRHPHLHGDESSTRHAFAQRAQVPPLRHLEKIRRPTTTTTEKTKAATLTTSELISDDLASQASLQSGRLHSDATDHGSDSAREHEHDAQQAKAGGSKSSLTDVETKASRIGGSHNHKDTHQATHVT
ncbi:unnamed protein product, partial [Amoebophrya sp. A25]|eukprot:GSA25T00023079001.1